MKTTVITATTVTLHMGNIDSNAIAEMRFMGTSENGTLEITFQSGAVYEYYHVPFVKVALMASLVGTDESVGAYFVREIRNGYAFMASR